MTVDRVTVKNPGQGVTLAEWANPDPRHVPPGGTTTVDAAAAPSLIGCGWDVVTAPVDDDGPQLPAAPGRSASKADWLFYAGTIGAEVDDTMTRTQIIEAVEKAVEEHTKETAR